MSKKFFMRQWIGILGVVALLMGSLSATAEAVTPSAKEYTVIMSNSYDIFIGSREPVNAKAGDEVYLVYTVESVNQKETTSVQHGVVAANDNKTRYPYEENGTMKFSLAPNLLEEGKTYFFRFRYTDTGFEYVAAWAKGDDSGYITFPHSVEFGDNRNYKYFGIWFGTGNVSAELSHVLCYDKNGNDLGVTSSAATVLSDMETMQYSEDMTHSYDIKAEKLSNIAISNKVPAKGKNIYMEYTVKSSQSRLYQNGAINSVAPDSVYPHEKGLLQFESFYDTPGNGFLLEEGASYIVKFSRNEDNTGFMALAQRTKDGKTEMHAFPNPAGIFNPDAAYYSLWFGEGEDFKASFELVNFKCYDEEGNNLGVQTNQIGAEVVHYGEREDYSACSSLYYNKENGGIIALYDDKTAKVTKNGKTETVEYVILGDTLWLTYEDGKDSFAYLYQTFSNEEETYWRLGTCYISFVTNTDNPPETQKVDQETGYTALRPEDPKRDNAEFLGWVRHDGTEFDFDSIVTESATLYAKWSDGIAYEKTSVWNGNRSMGIAIGVSAALLAVGVAAAVILVRRGGKKYGNQKE